MNVQLIADRLISVRALARLMCSRSVSVAAVCERKGLAGTFAFALSVALEDLEPECSSYRSMDGKLRTKNGSVMHIVFTESLYKLRGLELDGVVFDTPDAAAGPMVLEFVQSRIRSENPIGVKFLGR